MSQTGERAGALASDAEEPSADRPFVVRVRDRCEPRLNDGYAGREFEVTVPSLYIARALVGALLERSHIEDPPQGRFVGALAGGSRTVTLEPVGGRSDGES